MRQPLIATDSVVATSSSDGPLTEERSSFLPSGVKRGSLWLAASILLAFLASWWSGADPDVASLEHLTPAVQSAAVQSSREAGGRRFVPIETLRVGDRVLADNPEDGKPAVAQPTQVDPATWRKLVLQGRLVWHDGTVDDINVETLQSPEWIAAHDAQAGNLVPMPLGLTEMGLPKGLKARVLENLPCPPIRPGPGRVVLTTVNHLNRYVFELRVEDESGRRTTLRPTGFHKFFSADRNDWISADSIREGERLTALGGTVRLLSRVRIPGTHRVYNLTVEGEHVYHVTKLVVDGHNQCGSGRTTWPSTADEMDDFLGVPGQRIPDGPTTPGRDKTVWRPNKDTKITLERHPYDPDAPDWHRDYHWHLDTPDNPHQRFLPGDEIPGLGGGGSN